jgi:chemotaxis protein CheD
MEYSHFLLEKTDGLRSIGIGELAISCDPNEILVTYALGSCIGITLYDPVAGIGGMVHCKMPDSSMDRNSARMNPAVCVDTGIPFLLDCVIQGGANKNRLIVKMAGASVTERRNDVFRIGERNYEMAKYILSILRLRIHAEECGESIPRTLYLIMETGKTVIRSRGDIRHL